ncbi:hypothetical protein KQX64_12325 [Rhodopseudomonas palustris]|nr:hypothetical protein KQX64_12325 [Rhodopseudomonas palustris]
MGEKRVASDDDRAAALNGGQAEAATLAEVWAVDPLILFRSCGNGSSAGAWHGPAVVKRARHHRSDTVRGWGCFIIGAQDMSLRERLAAIRPSPTIRISAFANGHGLRCVLRSLIVWTMLSRSYRTGRPILPTASAASPVRRHGAVCLAQTYRGIEGQS